MTPTPARRLSYAQSFDDPLYRAAVHALEWASAKPRLLARLSRIRRGAAAATGLPLVGMALEALGIAPQVARDDHIPERGALVVVANHPYGIVDGAALLAAIGAVRPDVKIMARSLATGIPEIASLIVAVPFAGAAGARRAVRAARIAARAHLRAGGALIVFPAGRVATDGTVRPAVDGAWSPLAVKLAAESDAAILPVFVDGGNSRFWCRVARVSPVLRQGLMLRQVVHAMDRPLPLVIGAPLAAGELGWPPRIAAARLRQRVLALGTMPRRRG